jgi:hypothetical protein
MVEILMTSEVVGGTVKAPSFGMVKNSCDCHIELLVILTSRTCRRELEIRVEYSFVSFSPSLPWEKIGVLEGGPWACVASCDAQRRSWKGRRLIYNTKFMLLAF